MNSIDFEALAQPFPEEYISWRPGSPSNDKKRAQALAYADPRAYEDRLNKVVGADWSCFFKPWGETRVICELTIQGVTRSSTGEFDDSKRNAIAEGTVAEAQAFRRACSKFGLGRYLYDIPVAWVDYDENKKRLLETPRLSSRYLPNPNAKGTPPATPGIGVQRAAVFVLNAYTHFKITEEQVQAAVNFYVGDSKSNPIENLDEEDVKKVWGYLKHTYSDPKKLHPQNPS